MTITHYIDAFFSHSLSTISKPVNSSVQADTDAIDSAKAIFIPQLSSLSLSCPTLHRTEVLVHNVIASAAACRASNVTACLAISPPAVMQDP